MNTLRLTELHKKAVAILEMIETAKGRMADAQKQIDTYKNANPLDFPWKDYTSPFYIKRFEVNDAIIYRLRAYYYLTLVPKIVDAQNKSLYTVN